MDPFRIGRGPRARAADATDAEPVAKSATPSRDAPLDLPPPVLPPLPEVKTASVGQLLQRLTQKIVSFNGPVPALKLPAGPRMVLSRALPSLAGAVVTEPHPALANPFDVAALLDATPAEKVALERYLSPTFKDRAPAMKQVVLRAIDRLFMPGEGARVSAYHLPRPFGADSAGKHVTYSMEAEQLLNKRPRLLELYAPDPTGALDPRALSAEVREAIIPRGLTQAWLRMSPEQQLKNLRWKDLSLSGKVAYLLEYQKKVDERVTLHRITDPAATNNANVAPGSFQRTIKWEGHTPLRCAEIITDGKYDSLDQLYADIAFVRGIDEKQPGFHVHHVVELSTEEDVKRLGPPLTGLVALQDLQLFANSIKKGGSLLRHTHLEVWQASGVDEVSKSFATGAIDPDAIGIHKFHCVGLRTAMYGDPKRVGIEIRAIAVGATELLHSANARMADILEGGHFQKLGNPPLTGWNAGDPELPSQVEAAARKSERFAEKSAEAQVDFQSILELAAAPNPARDTFRFASPFWAFEKLPGVTPAEAQKITSAREAFIDKLFTVSIDLGDAIDGGRELDGEWVRLVVEHEIRRFFATVNVDDLVSRTLDRLAEGRDP